MDTGHPLRQQAAKGRAVQVPHIRGVQDKTSVCIAYLDAGAGFPPRGELHAAGSWFVPSLDMLQWSKLLRNGQLPVLRAEFALVQPPALRAEILLVHQPLFSFAVVSRGPLCVLQ
jgi:hypothetical protein